jgi:signal peptide peptidase SppA
VRYINIVRAVCNTPWAILPEKLNQITAFIELKASGIELSAEQIQAAVGDKKPLPRSNGAIAVIPIYGVISQRLSMMNELSGPGSASTEQITRAFRQAMADPNIGSIVFDIDSPGGTVTGTPELADEILKARGQKPIVAVANSMAASAAYWIASAADELVVSPSGEVGSIGVYMGHIDISKMEEMDGVKTTLISAGKYKIEGNPYEPLTEEAKAALQADVDAFYSMFVKAVAKQRGVSASDVRNGFGEGRTVMAAEAVKLGMADRVGTLDQTLQRLGGTSRAASKKTETEAPPITGEVQTQPVESAADTIIRTRSQLASL